MLNKNKQRELAYVVKIDRIEPIQGSDNCESAVVGGWHIMTRKGTFEAGDHAIYFEIDSKVPATKEFEFLASKHYKIKTQKYTFGGKGNFISQGLLMAFSDFEIDGKNPKWLVDTVNLMVSRTAKGKDALEEPIFLTKELGVAYSVEEDNRRKNSIDKYKKMAQRHSQLFKNNTLIKWLYKRMWGKKLLFIFLGRKRDAKVAYWPRWVKKTDEERAQNLPQLFPSNGIEWFVTEKIDGSSTTFTMKKGKRGKYEFFVCSRNVCFDKPEKEEKLFYEKNIYTEMAIKYDIEKVLHKILYEVKGSEFLDFVTIQGETFGAGVQKRDYHMKNIDFRAFNLIYGNKDGKVERMNPREMTEILSQYNVPCVPILDEHFKLPDTVDEMIAYADGNSEIDGDYREGVVLRTADGINSFKAVSNTYLLNKKGE